MSTIHLRDAAKHFKQLPHQLAAWDWLQERVSKEALEQFAELYRADPVVKDPLPAAWLAPALKLIKKWEGCRLEAYRCPADVPTIGYGATRLANRAVRMGDTITQQEADEMLLHEVENLFAPGVFALLPLAKKWRGEQTAAIISFAYNVGLGALEESTLRKRLLAGEDATKVVIEELPRWNKAGSKVLEGLVNRRKDEVALFTGSVQKQQGPPKLRPTAPFSAKLTPHIAIGEFALNQEERRFAADYQIKTATELAEFLEKVRAHFGGKPLIITSGYRPVSVNRMVGGASSSEHLFDAPDVGAVDFYIEGADIYKVQEYCDKHWPHSVGYGAPKGFVHLGIRKGRPRVRWNY
jgi:GH24 family phage-related lysozyme (muramidase)